MKGLESFFGVNCVTSCDKTRCQRNEIALNKNPTYIRHGMEASPQRIEAHSNFLVARGPSYRRVKMVLAPFK